MPAALEEWLPAELAEKIRRGAKWVDEVNAVRIISDHDGDGIAAAAILVKAARRKGKRIHATISRKMTDGTVEQFKAEGNDLVLISDSGSGQIDIVEDVAPRVVILDHHTIVRESEAAIQINPRLHDVDGTTEACAASICLAFALGLDEANWDLAPLALTGIVSDMQHMGGLQGMNRALMDEARERGHFEIRRGLTFTGKTALDALAHTPFPFFAGVTGREEPAAEVLKEAGVDPEERLDKADPDALRTLTSALSIRLMRQGARSETIQQTLVDDNYWLPSWGLYAHELSALLNGCGRMDQGSLGLAVALGDPQARSEAMELQKDYSRELMASLLKAEKEGAYAREHIQFIYADRPNLAGVTAGVMMQYLFDQEKPTLGLAVADGKTKVSGRGTRYLTAKGLDLAIALDEASREVGGSGGGHDVAAGAVVPKGKEDKFLDTVDAIVGSQLA
jgi:RecJ-like exonuclease